MYMISSFDNAVILSLLWNTPLYLSREKQQEFSKIQMALYDLGKWSSDIILKLKQTEGPLFLCVLQTKIHQQLDILSMQYTIAPWVGGRQWPVGWVISSQSSRELVCSLTQHVKEVATWEVSEELSVSNMW